MEHLQDFLLRVTCAPDEGGNRTWQLNCSLAIDEDGVAFSWTSERQSTGPTLKSSVIKVPSQDQNIKLTCTADNRVSKASRTVSLKEVCADFENRANISKDCRELHLSQLRKEDAGRYSAGIVLQNETLVDEFFGLEVFNGTKSFGILGEFVTFQVKTSPPYEMILWTKTVGIMSINIGKGILVEQCYFLFLEVAFQNRVNISKDCRELHLSQLRKDDAGRYTAQIVLQNKTVVNEFFGLQVFGLLLDSEMRVTCTPDGAGSEAWKLNCSTGTKGDGVGFSWESPIYCPSHIPHDPVIKVTSQDHNVNVTCTAENPVSQASRTVTLKEVCAEQTENISRLPLWVLLCLSKVGSLLLLGCLGLIFRMTFRKDGGRRLVARFRPASQRRPPPLPRARPHFRST
ncbi:SLAM family member 5-like [Ahaetulla prasina]|uniref:SLAM family member 5-like n=1 Tax=Ahaetulla prasina TaxID=499056 RepID=UPI002648301F|nr:SLAM family member 5-like [Ahaetulla prasina]